MTNKKTHQKRFDAAVATGHAANIDLRTPRCTAPRLRADFNESFDTISPPTDIMVRYPLVDDHTTSYARRCLPFTMGL